MKSFKIFTIIAVLAASSILSSVSSIATAQSSTAVVGWMFENGLTKFDTQEDF